jgi:outer membrane protein TolC
MYRIIYLFLGLVLSIPSFAQTISLSLEEAHQMAMDSSYAMRDAQYNIDKKIKEVKEILAFGLPQVNASADYQNFLEIPTSLIPAEAFGGTPGEFTPVQFGVKHNFTAGITASQLLFDGTYLVGLKASKIVVDLTEYQSEKTAQQVRLNVSEAYYTVLLAEANLQILEESAESLQKTLDDTQAMFEAGMTEEQDVDQIQLNLNQYKINIDNTKRYREVSKQILNFVIGISLSQEVVLTDEIESLVRLNNNESYLTREPNLMSHPDYLVARTNVELQQLSIENEKAAYYPSLNANITFQEQAQRQEFNFFESDEVWFPTSFVGVNLRIPIFSSFQRKARVQQAEIGRLQSLLQMQQTEENLRLEVIRRRSDFNNALKVWANQKESLELAKRISNKTQIKYTEGVASSFELNVAEQQLLSEQEKYIRAAFDVLTAKQELDKALNVY